MQVKLFFVVIAVGALSVSGCNYFKKHRLFSKDVDTVLDMTVAEPEPVLPDSAFVDEYIEPVAMEPATSSSSGKKYFMIVGSFQNRNLAESYSNKIRQMGYTSEIIEANNGYFRVTAKSYSDYRTGISEIETFRESVSSNAWLHVKK